MGGLKVMVSGERLAVGHVSKDVNRYFMTILT